MNTTILEAYKALPYGNEFITWLNEKGILESFINQVETRNNREGRSVTFYPNRCASNVPNQYVTLSLYFVRCVEGDDFWRDIHNQWGEACREHGYAPKQFTFDVYSLATNKLVFDAYTKEEAEIQLKTYVERHNIREVAHELVSSESQA